MRDAQSGLSGVEIEIRDPQGRWRKVSRAYEASGERFTTTITWDRRFADGTLAPIGTYDVVVKAFDRAGNMQRATGQMVIPAPNVTPTPLSTRPPVLAETTTAQPGVTTTVASSPTLSPSSSLPASPAFTPTQAVVASSFQSSSVLSVSPSVSSGSSSAMPLFGAAALAAIATANGVALAAKRRRKEEEREQAERVRAAVEAKNAALEALKVRNWLMGQAMLRNALEQAELLSTAEKDKVQAEARMKGISAALGLLDTFKRAAQARLEASWKAMEMRIQQAEEALERRLQQQAQQRALQQAQQLANQPLDSATRSYMAWAKAVEEGKFDAQAYAQGIEQASLSQVACTAESAQPSQPKSWWQRANDWLQDKVNRFVTHPPSWLSVSYSPKEFSVGNYTAAHWVSYQPLARNLWEGITYQQVDVGLKMKPTLTTNPDGVVDINLGDGTITFNGKNSNFFIQPTALSFGWGGSLKPNGLGVININQTVVDFDLGGPNFLSLKVSHAEGYQTIEAEGYVEGTKVQKTGEVNVEVTVNVHRWPRVIAAAAALYFVFEAGVTAIAPRVLPWAAEKIPAIVPLLGVP